MLCVVAPPGDQLKLPPPVDGVTVSVALCPAQIVSELTVTLGAGLTVTVALADPIVGQPGRV